LDCEPTLIMAKAFDIAGLSCLVVAGAVIPLFRACDPFEIVCTELRSFGLKGFNLGTTASCLRDEVFVGRIYDGTDFVETPLTTGAGSA
jgi:hypothetical protein